ncbi:ATP-binding cassette domain-containing protein [Puniceibacterium sp. HSS470]|nr:ATP-binding cassette domain-containing protein [Puniceibacterium sp. HSS470]
MRHLLSIAILLVNADRWAMARGALLAVTVLVMGAALLGLSGWFITATGLAGLAGIGIAFDVFRPSAGVRFLALGRAAARYGERLLTHDATLRALAALRVVLLRGFARSDARELARLRGEGALTRIVSDVDALDGVVLRLILPLGAAILTHALVFAVLGLIVGWSVAIVIAGLYLSFGLAILLRLGRRTVAPASEAETQGQHLRRGVIDMIRDREALIVAAVLKSKEDRLRQMDGAAREAARQLDRAERMSGFWMSLLIAGVAMSAFLMGAALLDAGSVGPAKAVIGLFVALALAEALLSLRRGVSELGRMSGAAARISNLLPRIDQTDNWSGQVDAPLLSLRLPGGEREFRAGETVALTGPSGVGKSMLLVQIAGLLPTSEVMVKGLRPDDYADDTLRGIVSMLPQRSSLIAGTVRDNLSLSGDFTDAEMWNALQTVVLADALIKRDGLDTKLGEGGAGLSGGQSRRLALARNLLKRSEILLLDEPTEGLDAETADAVIQGVRAALPDALIIATMHSGANHSVFKKTIELSA